MVPGNDARQRCPAVVIKMMVETRMALLGRLDFGGAAADLLATVTAPARHGSRVDATLQAALATVDRIAAWVAVDDPDDDPDAPVLALSNPRIPPAVPDPTAP
jgi:hypothetical protein